MNSALENISLFGEDGKALSWEQYKNEVDKTARAMGDFLEDYSNNKIIQGQLQLILHIPLANLLLLEIH